VLGLGARCCNFYPAPLSAALWLRADASRFEGVTKRLSYRNLGLRLQLEKEQVYLLAIHGPK